MKQTLVLGSTVVDVILSLPSLPPRGNDVNIISSEYRIGGCAYNVYKTLTSLKSPACLCSPAGTGIFGAMVKEHLEKESLPYISLEEENGCCYCLVEPDGERTFLSHHGADYRFSLSWMNSIDLSQTGGIYICGIDLEDPCGDEIVDFVYEHREQELYFAPGPRIAHITRDRVERLLKRQDKYGKGPFLHLNAAETAEFSGKKSVEEGAEFFAGITGNSLVITMGKKGCYCLEKADPERAGAAGHFIPGFPAKAVNTVGAGDAHCGAVIAFLKEGLSLEAACVNANKIGAAVAEKGIVMADAFN